MFKIKKQIIKIHIFMIIKINHLKNSWSLVGSKAEIKQDEADEWFGMTWSNPESITVEPYKMDPRIGYKSFDMVLEDGKKITFYRIQEHPQLKLYRNDEKLLYSYPSDLGFTMLNPHPSSMSELKRGLSLIKLRM